MAWVALLWLAVGPFYQGASVTLVTPGDGASESIRVTSLSKSMACGCFRCCWRLSC